MPAACFFCILCTKSSPDFLRRLPQMGRFALGGFLAIFLGL